MPPATSPSKADVLERATTRLFGRPTLDVNDLLPARLAACSEAQVRAAAQVLELADAAVAPTSTLVARLSQVLARLAVDAGTAASEAEAPEDEDRSAGSRFDLGPVAADAAPRHIPWSYGQDRITAMVVNPHTLYAYWELSDEAMEFGRRGLGPAGRDAWPNLRIYDVSGRIFDGTNAHGYVDHKLDRGDRQWFVEVGRPGSTAIVELGMKSAEGFFVKLARSGRADFPRHAAASPAAIEWLTVRTAEGSVEAPLVTAAPECAAPEAATTAHVNPGVATAAAQSTRAEEAAWRELTARLWSEHSEVIRRDWVEAGRAFEWLGPLVRTSWEAGPFPVPVDLPEVVTERHEGPTAVYSFNGQTRVVFGPWQVVIRGLGGWAERRVLARWDVHTSWVAGEGFVSELRRQRLDPSALMVGGSEALFEGASELRWLFGSELRLSGASEVFFLGASELRRVGASEMLLAGASEYRFAGASELRYAGASEAAYHGASELLGFGASEHSASALES